jgi:hypothetical protein
VVGKVVEGWKDRLIVKAIDQIYMEVVFTGMRLHRLNCIGLANPHCPSIVVSGCGY